MTGPHDCTPPAESGNANDEVAASVISRSRRSRGATANDPQNGRQAAPAQQPNQLGLKDSKGRRMAFTFAAFCYMLALLLTAALIFFAIWHVSVNTRSARSCPRLSRRVSGADGIWVERRGRQDPRG